MKLENYYGQIESLKINKALNLNSNTLRGGKFILEIDMARIPFLFVTLRIFISKKAL